MDATGFTNNSQTLTNSSYSTSINKTDYYITDYNLQMKRQNEREFIMLIVNICFAALNIFVNSFVLTLFLARPKLRKTSSNRILSSLVISDLVTGLMMIAYVVIELNDNLKIPKTPAEFTFRILIDIAATSIQLASIGNLFLIIIERFISLVSPYAIQRYLSRRRVAFAILAVWIIAFLVPCIQLIWLYKLMTGTATISDDNFIRHADSIFSAFTIFFFALCPMCALFFMFVRMFQEIKMLPSNDQVTKQREEHRVLTIFGVMYVFFTACTLPYFLLRLAVDMENLSVYDKIEVPNNMVTTIHILRILPPLVNPFIYSLNKPDFRRELRRFLKKTKQGHVFP